MKLKKLTSVDMLYVAASMTRPDQKITPAALERIHRSQGYSKCAVHFVITTDGRVHNARPTDTPGCLAGTANNQRSLQVCLIGGVDEQLRPSENFSKRQRDALRKLAHSLELPLVFDPACPLQKP